MRTDSQPLHVIARQDLRRALLRAKAGEAPDLIMDELWATAARGAIGGTCTRASRHHWLHVSDDMEGDPVYQCVFCGRHLGAAS